jgi:hypothetical protein
MGRTTKSLALAAGLALGTLALVGCAHAAATPVIGPDGKLLVAIRCEDGDMTNCLRLAGEECGVDGYDTRSTDERTGFSAQAYANSSAATANVHDTFHGFMLIGCHGKTRSCPNPPTCAPPPAPYEGRRRATEDPTMP